MSQKRIPYFFLSFLLLILFFVVGLRWGQNIEKTNKIINYLISIPPTATLIPTQLPLKFEAYKHTGCAIQFLKPTSFNAIMESSTGAILREGNKMNVRMSFDCDKKATPPSATASVEILFQKQTILSEEKPNSYLFSLKNPSTKLTTIFFVDKSLYPLLEKSLEFVSK